jgi:integrase
MRKGEVLALTDKDFDFSNNTVKVNKSLVIEPGLSIIKDSPKSDNGFRTIPLPDSSIPYIKPYVQNTKGLLFHTKSGGTFTATEYRRLWARVLKAMNKVSEEKITGLTAHIFRHNYCTELCYKVPQISTKMIARLMGDKENMVLEVYSHLVEERENPCSVLNEIF